MAELLTYWRQPFLTRSGCHSNKQTWLFSTSLIIKTMWVEPWSWLILSLYAGHRALLDGFPILNNGPADRLELFTWQLWFSISYWISLMPNGFRFFVFVFANVRIPALESSRQTSCFSNWIKLRLLYSENKAQRETMQLSPDNWSQFVRHSLQYWCARHLVSTNVLPWHNWCPIAKSNFSSDGG